MKIQVALTLAVVACFQLVAANSFLDDVEPRQPHLPFDPSWAEGSLKEVFDAVNSTSPNPHIVGGKESVPHSHPHQVALLIEIDRTKGICGGSLISDQWVITTAYCVFRVDNIMVIVGAHNILQEESTARRIKVAEVIVNRHYNKFNLRNDIALLKLESRVTLDKTYVNAIRLPKVSQTDESFYGRSVTISGWGKQTDSDSSLVVAPGLREVHSGVVSNSYCSLWYLFSSTRVQDTMICVSGWKNWKTRGSCYGDAGGPMSLKEEDGESTLVGITSFGIPLGCQWTWPSVATRVTSYLDWIHSTTGIAPRV